MTNVVEIQVTAEKVILKIPHKNIVDEVDNIASSDSKTKRVISAGLSQTDMQEKYPKMWNKHKHSMEFHPIFDGTSFNPEVAGMYLWKWWDEKTEMGVAGNIVLRSQAKLDINISFDRYKEIPADKQQEFEYLVFRYLYAKSLKINGVEKQWNRKSNPPVWLFSILNFVFVVGSIILGVIPVLTLTTLLSAAKLSSTLSSLLFILALFGGFYVFMVVGDFVSRFLWIICMKPFYSKKMIARALEYQANLPQKHKSGKLTKLLNTFLLAEDR
ncbi:MAG: hypothetical protein QY306_05640 [Anaerolineales bacterium]|nr:MAG: hypothetical protein QY306_05640 [Anaerolineales bacterium]